MNNLTPYTVHPALGLSPDDFSRAVELIEASGLASYQNLNLEQADAARVHLARAYGPETFDLVHFSQNI